MGLPTWPARTTQQRLKSNKRGYLAHTAQLGCEFIFDKSRPDE